MTVDEQNIAKGFRCIRIPFGGFNRRFIDTMVSMVEMKPETPLTEKQNEWMFKLLYTYRRQIPETYERYRYHPFCNRGWNKNPEVKIVPPQSQQLSFEI